MFGGLMRQTTITSAKVDPGLRRHVAAINYDYQRKMEVSEMRACFAWSSTIDRLNACTLSWQLSLLSGSSNQNELVSKYCNCNFDSTSAKLLGSMKRNVWL